MRYRYQRLRRAFAYATGRLSPGEAQTILIECQDYAGWYPLNTLCVDDLLAHAACLHGDNAHLLKPYLDPACERTARKWDCGDELNIALDFALELAREYAAVDGIDVNEDQNVSRSQPEGARP